MDSKSQLQALSVCLLMFFSSLVIAQDLSNKVDSVSYSLGLMIGKNIKDDGIKNINPEIVAKALEDVMQDDGDYMITRQAAKIYYTNYMTALKEEKTKAARADGEAYLVEVINSDLQSLKILLMVKEVLALISPLMLHLYLR